MESFRQKFIEEASELISQIESDLLAFEKNPNDNSTLSNIVRVMHTLKGSSSMFGFDSIVELSHKTENILKKISNNEIRADRHIIDLTFASVDLISKLFTDKNIENEQNKKKYEQISEQLNSLFEEDKHEETSQTHSDCKFYYVIFEPDDDYEERGVNLRTIFKEIEELGKSKIVPKSWTKEGKYQLHWEIYIATDKDLDDVEEIFMFVDMESEIHQLADENLLQNQIFVKKISAHAKQEDLLSPEDLQAIIEELHNPKAKQEAADDSFTEITSQKKSSIRVNAEKLDDIMTTVSELMTLKSKIALHAETKTDLILTELSENLNALTNKLKDSMFSIRLMPLKSIKNQFERLVRDTANILNKKVDFTTENLNIELDKSIIEGVSSPILHLIRNSIDHGIEAPDVRIKKGKSEYGKITLSAERSGAFVFIIIEDDGAGIDKERILQKAIAKQIISSTQQLSDKEIYDLIFMPGFSTAQNLSEISGRGVGMDVVKNEIEKLRGSIIIESEADKGTKISLRLPVSLSIIDTILIQSGDLFFSVPVEEIEHCKIVNPDDFDKNKNHYLKHNSDLIPYVNLNQTFNIKTKYEGRPKIVIVKNNGKAKAIITDKIIGEYQAIVKPISDTFNKDYISGGSILPDGNIAYILDTEKLRG